MLIPIIVSIKLLIWGFNQTDAILGDIIFKAFQIRIIGLGLISLLFLIFITGMIARNYLGRKLIDLGERLLHKIPILNSIYGTAKQITDSLSKADKTAFRKVVMVEYPRPGIFSPGFLTGAAPIEANVKTNEKLLSVFIPTPPNPATGFLIFVPEEAVTILDMSIEDGLKLVISVGVIKPD